MKTGDLLSSLRVQLAKEPIVSWPGRVDRPITIITKNNATTAFQKQANQNSPCEPFVSPAAGMR